MKIYFWKQRLARLLAGCGVMLPAVVDAADLNTNLVLNASFEDVDLGDPGPFTGVRIFDWEDADEDDDDTYAYPYSSNYSGAPAPPGSDDYHFTGGFNTTAGEVQVFQVIDLSRNPAAARIAGGDAAYSLSGFFSTYRTQADSSSIRAIFLGDGNQELQSAAIGGSEFVANLNVTGDRRDWGQDVDVGLIPVGTRSVEIQIVAEFGVTNHDGYVDLVGFQVNEQLTLPVLDLQVDRSGAMQILNRTGGPVDISAYSIKSDYGALDPAQWKSIAENYDADGDQSVDPNNAWTLLPSPRVNDDLSEGDLDSGFGSTLDAEQIIDLGNPWIQTPVEDVVFQYVSGAAVVQGLVSFTGNDGRSHVTGDLNGDFTIDEADWRLFRDGQHRARTSESGALAYRNGDLNGDLINNHTDFVMFQTLFDEANGQGAFAAMLSVPEPAAGSLLSLAMGSWLVFRRRRRE